MEFLLGGDLNHLVYIPSISKIYMSVAVGMVISSEGSEADVLVKSDLIELGTILRISDSYGIVAHMHYKEDEKIGSKQKLIARVDIFGKISDSRLVRIKRPIEPYTEVFLADKEELEGILSSDSDVSIGRVYGTEARAFLNPLEYDRHLAILASTGAGKSYTAANLIKEFSSLGLPVIVIDTHGEYPKLLSKCVDSSTKIDIHTVKHPKQGYRELKIPVSELSTEDFTHFIYLNETQRSALGLILDRLSGKEFLLQDVIQECDRIDDNLIHEETAKALKRRLVSLERIFRNVFDKFGTGITGMVKPYQITIIDASYASQGVRQAVVSYIAKELLHGRIREENEIEGGIESPLLLVVEEAHNYCSAKLSHSCKYQLQRIASEGRKFGLGLCVISQKPSKIDEEILSQCNTGMYMHITNPNDKDHIRKSFESINDEIIKDLDSLDVGECIIAGAMNRIPFLICEVDRIEIEKEKQKKFDFKIPQKVEVGGFGYV